MIAGHPGAGRDPIFLHEGDGDHVHEMAPGPRGELVEYIWKVENVELTTVGIDIGSSTSHLMFAAVRLQRKTQSLSSRFVVVERRILWKSPILLTPFLADGSIDAARLAAFVAQGYKQAGLAAGDVDSGAVILTGEAIKRTNARAIAELFAAEGGKFVCASAGHHLESALAAHGSGAVAMSRETPGAILNVDIGGGTTKFALVAAGEVLATCAFAVGGRLIAFDADSMLTRVDDPARLAAQAAGVTLSVGERAAPETLRRVVDKLADAAIAMIAGEQPSLFANSLLVTESLPLPWERAGERVQPVAITFSGGLSEYIYGRETREFGDIAPLLAGRISAACRAGRIAPPLVEPREGIRATVIGASQFTVQVSGKTIHIGGGARLPLRNVPVIAPRLNLEAEVSAAAVAAAIRSALTRGPAAEDRTVAIAVRWRGDPHHRRLRALAEGIAAGLSIPSERAAAVLPLPWERAGVRVPVILLVDGDVGRTLGHILEDELHVDRGVIAIDGIEVGELDFIDIGEVLRPADVVPVVIKSLLFSGAAAHASQRPAPAYRPVTEAKAR